MYSEIFHVTGAMYLCIYIYNYIYIIICSRSSLCHIYLLCTFEHNTGCHLVDHIFLLTLLLTMCMYSFNTTDKVYKGCLGTYSK